MTVALSVFATCAEHSGAQTAVPQWTPTDRPQCRAADTAAGHLSFFLVPVCACFCLVAANIGICMTTTWATGPLCKVLPLIGFSDEKCTECTQTVTKAQQRDILPLMNSKMEKHFAFLDQMAPQSTQAETQPSEEHCYQQFQERDQMLHQ